MNLQGSASVVLLKLAFYPLNVSPSAHTHTHTRTHEAWVQTNLTSEWFPTGHDLGPSEKILHHETSPLSQCLEFLSFDQRL